MACFGLMTRWHLLGATTAPQGDEQETLTMMSEHSERNERNEQGEQGALITRRGVECYQGYRQDRFQSSETSAYCIGYTDPSLYAEALARGRRYDDGRGRRSMGDGRHRVRRRG